MGIEVTLRKWGNSLGVILPREFVKERGLKANQKIVLEVTKKADLSAVYGSLKSRCTAQELKDIAREGWN
ncbi:MAG: AbrB/MazE/SpoVT family DNA-binding domain-containing protein [Candidatus Altiarchaeota archaeon]|nr:AbrB/MazE/SpoVT family DNA-binding domain-containing protein [Candidatus Altiarchaeota archaeon]